MFASIYKPVAVVTAMFMGGFLFGQLWHYLGDRNSIVNRYLEAHNSRFLNTDNATQVYYVFYNDMHALNGFADARIEYSGVELTSIDKLATVNIDNNSLPDSLDLLREQDFVRFIFPGTFPFICH